MSPKSRENTIYIERKHVGADFSPVKINLFVFEYFSRVNLLKCDVSKKIVRTAVLLFRVIVAVDNFLKQCCSS